MTAISGFPKIPNYKGLVSSVTNAIIGLSGAALIQGVFGNVWGLFNEFGVPVIKADNVLGLSYQNASNIANAPIESGTFASYNKIASPAKAMVQMSKGSGGALERGAFLAQMLALADSTLSFYIITPEFVHRNMQIVGVDYARSAGEGRQLIVVNVQLEEVREVKVDYSYQEVKAPADAKTVDGGTVQPKEVSQSNLDKIAESKIGTAAIGAVKGVIGL